MSFTIQSAGNKGTSIHSNYVSAADIDFIRHQRQQQSATRATGLATELVDLIHQRGWLRTTLPAAIGQATSAEQPLNAYELALLFEALAYADASLGWLVNLGAGANMFLGYLPPAKAQELAANPKLWLAGSGAVSGRAQLTATGNYLLEGSWKYASGSSHATHFTANAYIYTLDGQPLLDAQQQPVYLSFLVPAHQVIIKPTWQTLGLQASASNDFCIQQLEVEASASFDLTQPSRFSHLSLYRYPFTAFAITNIAVMCSGMAQHFWQLFQQEVLQQNIEQQDLKQQAAASSNNLAAVAKKLSTRFYRARQEFLTQVEQLYLAVDAQQPPYNLAAFNLQEQQLADQAQATVDAAFELVMGLYRFCGMRSVYNSHPISQVVRDFLVATQHRVIRPRLVPK